MRAPWPPRRLEDDLVVLACAAPSHLHGLQAALETSHAELRMWMDWVGDEPQPLEATRAVLEAQAAAWASGVEFRYTMLDRTTGEVVGTCSLMSRPGPGRLEIGYWVRSDRAGAGIATAAARLLTTAGFTVDGVEIIEIHHDAANIASGRVADKLGYTEAARREVEIDSPGECGIEVIWEISRAAWS